MVPLGLPLPGQIEHPGKLLDFRLVVDLLGIEFGLDLVELFCLGLFAD